MLVGVQDMPLWYADYFEIKATETLQTQEKLLPTLNSLEKFKLEALHIIRIITRNNILWSIWQGKLLVTEFISTLLPLDDLPPFWSPNAECHIASFVHIYLISSFCLWTTHVCGVSHSLMNVGLPCVRMHLRLAIISC